MLHAATTSEFSPAFCVVGAIVAVPLSLIDLNEFGPRRMYTHEVVDKIAKTMPAGQDVAAHGYLQDGRIKLIDGGTRFRAVQISGKATLDVKIEPAPKDNLALFLRARELNENRSDTTALDFALSLKALIDGGAVKNQRELAEKVPNADGTKMHEASVSQYMRIAGMPEKIQRAMGESEATSTFTALYEVSALFKDQLEGDALMKAIELALSIVEETKLKQLNKKQISALVTSKIEGPKTRVRSLVHPIQEGRVKGQIKTFEKRGQIDMTLRGLQPEQLPLLREKIEALIKSFSDTASN